MTGRYDQLCLACGNSAAYRRYDHRLQCTACSFRMINPWEIDKLLLDMLREQAPRILKEPR